MKTSRMISFLMIIVLISIFGLQIVHAQEGTVLAGPGEGQTSYEFVAQIEQSLFNLDIYGYFTHVNGVTSDLLFVEGTSPADRSEAEAFFTFHATGGIYSRSVHQPIFNTNANMTMTVYYHETPGASFEDLATFSAGIPVAVYTVRLQNILNVQAPDIGIALSNGETVQTESMPFTFNGQEVTFGHVGMMERLNAFGQGFRQSQEPLAVRLIVAGNSIVTGMPE